MIQRHQDYLIRVPSVPVGGGEFSINLDTDAPFALRLVRSRNIGVSGWNFQTPRRQWQSSKLRTDVQAQFGTNFRPSRGSIIYPQMVYPVGGTIPILIGNETGAPILDAQLLFRGSKYFEPGRIAAPTYPAQVSPLKFDYQVVVPNVGGTDTIRFNQLRVKKDADFAVRFGVCDPFTPGVESGSPFGAPILAGDNLTDGPNFGQGAGVYVQLVDEVFKPYSNIPIHINDLFGQGRPLVPLSSGAANDDSVLFFPGLYTPEIYVQREHSLYVDVYREDGAGAPPVNLYFRFGGCKAFAR